MRILIFINLLLIVNSYKCQDGPGGVGNTSSNGLWLKADELKLSDDADVSNWGDASGNNNNALQTSVSLQPKFFNTSLINGMPIIRFDGNDDEMAVLDSPLLDGSVGITFYAVLRPNNLNGQPRGILGKRITFGDASNYAYTWFFWSGNRLNLDVNTQNNRFNTGSSTFSNANNYMLSWTFDGSLPQSIRSSIRQGSSNILSASESSNVLVNSIVI